MRSEGGYGNECSLISFPINYAASVAVGLSFMNEWKRINPRWLAKDLVVLFYDDSSSNGQIGENYAKSVREFLQMYYIGHDSLNDQDMVKNLLDDDKVIHGRCGYLRQGLPMVFKDYEFNKINMHLDGVNGKLSDIDYYDTLLYAIQEA